MPKRRILMLQGPVGGFFRYLQERLTSEGFEVRRAVFNAGDLFFQLGRPYEILRPADGDYAGAIESLMRDWRPDAVLLFGDERPIHVAARAVAARLGIAVWCFEEGYVRPDFVTFERGGNNANSSLRLDFDPTLEIEAPPRPPRLPNSTRAMARRAIAYFVLLRTTSFLFPNYRHHRERALVAEFRYWVRSIWRQWRGAAHDEALIGDLLHNRTPPFFVLALQVHDDLQMVRHGRGWRTRDFLAMALESFRRHASPDHRLVIKAHPLDIGYGHHRKNLRIMAEESGLGERVIYLQSGAFLPVVRHARGLVTVNSTAGIAALECGVPVIAFGEALYHQPGLAIRAEGPADLDRFWNDPPPVDTVRAHRFNVHVVRTALVPGNFYLSKTWPSMAEAVVEKLRTAPQEAS
jgi:capsular polysaccharide export protein